MRQQSVRQYPGAFMALVVGIAVIALGMARLAAAQNVCFAVCDQCESDSSQDRCTSTPYPRNCVTSGDCVEGFQLNIRYLQENECEYNLVTYRNGCPDLDDENNVTPESEAVLALNRTQIINFNGKTHRCVSFPGLGYTLFDANNCKQ